MLFSNKKNILSQQGKFMLKKNLILITSFLLMIIGCNENKESLFKIDYEKLVNIYYFLKARAVWCELPEELVSVMNKCVVKDKRIVN